MKNKLINISQFIVFIMALALGILGITTIVDMLTYVLHITSTGIQLFLWLIIGGVAIYPILWIAMVAMLGIEAIIKSYDRKE